MRVVRNAVLCCCLGSTVALPWFQSDKQPTRPLSIELTEADLFSVKDWTSAQVQIAGLRLGMTRAEANAAFRKAGLQLSQYGQPQFNLLPCSDGPYCFLKYEHVGVLFAKTGEILEIQMDVPPAEYRGDLIRKFKGQTRRLFENKYTDGLRLRLLGPESSREVIDARDTKYVYAKRGFTMTVARQGAAEPGYELDGISFIPPAP